MSDGRLRVLPVCLAGLACSALLACAYLIPGEQPPEDFYHLSPEQVRTKMGRLALSVREIDRIMREGRPADDGARLALAQQLEQMDAIIEELQPEEWHSSHAEMARGFEALKHDVKLARRSVLADPPEYFFVGSVSAACTNCHEAR